MHTFDVKKIFYSHFSVEQDVKSPCTEEITARIKYKPGNDVNRIDILKGGDDITQIDLSKE